MDHQKNSLPSNANINFAANPFPSQFPGLNSVAGTSNVVTSPLFMSSLQQLSSGAAGFLPSTNQLGSSWNAQCQQTASWIDQANKMAVMLPMYNALQTAVNASDPSYIQQNFKNQAAVVAAAACMPNPLLFASQSLNAVTESFTAASSMSYTGVSNQPKTSNQKAWTGMSPPSCSQSASTSSHPPSHEAVDSSPLNYTTTKTTVMNEGGNKGGIAGNIAATRLSNASVEELSALELHDFGDYLIERAKDGCHNALFPASFFGVEDTLVPSTSKSLSMEQRSSSCETKPSSSSMRSHESMHDEQQAEELANADFELDRLVSLVARQNDANIIAPLPTTSSSLFSLDAFKTPDKSDKQPYLLNPPQFTPPDSPTNEDTEQKPCANILSLSTSQPFVFSSPNQSNACSTPSTSSASLQSKPDTPALSNKSSGLPLMFLPKISPSKSPMKNTSNMSAKMTGNMAINAARSTRVPIYKSSRSSIFTVKELAGPSTSASHDKPDDAFSFTDDEEPEPSIVPPTAKPANTPKIGVQSVYVPTTVNSSENESDLIKHVVPKKRHLVQKNVVEQTDPGASTVHNQFSSNILADDGATPQTSAACSFSTSTLVQLIRSRRSSRASSFLKSEYAEDNDCVCLEQEVDNPEEQQLPLATCFIKIEEPDEQQEGEMVRSNELPRPILPKLVIKLLTAKKESDQSMENEYVEMVSRKEKKKRKKKDKDKDWVMAGQEKSKKEKHKKKKHKKHKKEKRRKSMDCEVDPTSSPNHFGSDNSSRRASLIDDNWESSFHSKKRRLVNNQWNGSEETQVETPSTVDDNFVSARPKSKCDTSFVAERLKCFSKADGRSLPKGTFLVVKEEAFKSDCPLWKVDNQNLLQKYLPLLLNQPTATDEHVEDIRRYKNSSTYAGWCDQIADEYLIVEIRYVKHSRSENIIEPVIPIVDLIPAISSEIAGHSVVKTDEELRREKAIAVSNEEVRMGDNGLKTHVNTFLQALLNHAVTLNFLQTVKSTNDWNFLCALDEFDQKNVKACQKITNKVKWVDGFQAAMNNYTNLYTLDGDNFLVADTCQACANADISAILQLFTQETYNRDTLLVNEPNFGDVENPCLPAVEFLVCCGCKLAAKIYHGIYHMKYHTFKLAEEKLEAVCEENPELTSEAAVQLCLNNKAWIQNSLNEYMDLCRKADEGFT